MKTTIKRTVVGTIAGALFGGIIAAAIPSLLFGSIAMFAATHPLDRERDLKRLPHIVLLCGVSGVILGALAGCASQLPRRGVPFLRCCMVIAVPAVAVRLLTTPSSNVSEANQGHFSYIATFLTAFAATGVLIWYGKRRTQCPSIGNGAPKLAG